MNKKHLLLILLFLVVCSCKLYAQMANGTEVTMQGFHWESKHFNWYNIVKDAAPDLAESLIDAIWMPPPSDAASLDGYLPRQLYVIDNAYGTEAQHRNMINVLHSHGIKVIADIVINHRVGTHDWGDFTNPTWGCWAVVQGDSWPGACGNHDTGSHYDPARDLDHTNSTVRNDIKAWMSWLKNDVGYDGWRYDYVHGFGANFIKEYNDATNPYFSVGELWNNDRQVVVNWIDGTQGSSQAFDFPLKNVLHQAVNGQYWRLNDHGKAPGVIGWWPEKAVTFIDNHDTGSTQAYAPFPGDKVMQGYAYILTHPGTPMVFWEHYYDWNLYDEIKALIKIRKDNGLKNNSQINIQKSDYAYAAIVDGKVAVKIGPGNWAPSGSGWYLKTFGNDYAVWDRIAPGTGDPAQNITVYFKKPSNWGNNIGIHYWGAFPSGSLPDTQWPGVSMAAEGNNWFSYSFPASVAGTNLLFHDNSGRQTPDLYRDKTGWYENGSWYDEDPRTGSSNGLALHFKTTWTNPSVHYWNVTPSGAAENTNWPGMSMLSEGNSWWSYTIPGADCAHIVFSNNGSPQTADLFRCGEGWYMDGVWYNSNPEISSREEEEVAMDNRSAKAKHVREVIFGEESSGPPYGFQLGQNFPNPVGVGKATIYFSVEEDGPVELVVYNMVGKAVAVLANGNFKAEEMHRVTFEKGDLPPGIYSYRLSSNGKTSVKKMVIR